MVTIGSIINPPLFHQFQNLSFTKINTYERISNTYKTVTLLFSGTCVSGVCAAATSVYAVHV